MFKFIGNIFNFKLTWRLRLKFYYFFAKVHALAHFTYEEKKKKVFFSSVSVVYGSAWTIFYFLELIALLYSFSVSGMMFNGSVVLNFVHALELTTIVLKALFIYILQIIQSKDLVLLINDAISINQVINFTYRKEDNLYSQQFERLYNLKKRCLMLQSVLLFASYYIYLEQQDENNPTEITLGFLVVYTHFSTVVVSGIYFYGSLLFGYDFYYFLNRKLNLILKQFEFDRKSKFRTRTQSYCQACDDLDKISVVYTRINLYIVKINRMSVVQIAGELLGSFVMITSAVSNLPYCIRRWKLESCFKTLNKNGLIMNSDFGFNYFNQFCSYFTCFMVYYHQLSPQIVKNGRIHFSKS